MYGGETVVAFHTKTPRRQVLKVGALCPHFPVVPPPLYNMDTVAEWRHSKKISPLGGRVH